MESLPENEALDHFPCSPSQYTLSDILATLDVTLPERIAAKAMAELPDTLQTQQLPLRIPANHARFSTVVGRRGNLGVSTTGKAGMLLFGPYMPATPGAYEVVFDIRSSSDIDEVIILDVVVDKGKQILGKTEWRVGSKQPAKISFEVPEQGVADLECRVKVSKSVDCSVETLTFLTTKQAELHLAYLESGLISSEYYRGNRVVLAVSPETVWLSVSLAVAKYVFDQRGWRTIFLVDDEFNGDEFFSGLDFVLGWIRLCDFKSSLSILVDKPDVLLTHSDNFIDISEFFLSMNPGADLICYADGFRNAADGRNLSKIKNPKEVFYFSFKNFRTINLINGVNNIVIPSIYFDFSDGYIQSFFSRKKYLENYSIFFLRYWGTGGYKFPQDFVIASWVSTVKKFGTKNEIIVIKESIVNAGVIEEFRHELLAAGYKVKLFSEYAVEAGIDGIRYENKAYERLMRFGYLNSPRVVYTLDSSIPSILISSPYFNRSAKIILGVVGSKSLREFSGWSGFVQQNLIQQINSAQSLPDWQVIDFPDEPDLFLIESTKSDLNLATRGSVPHRLSFSPKYRQEQHWLTRHAEICAHSDKPAPQLLCFGDSLTQRLESHPDLLQQYLPYSILNAGFSGDRTEHLLWRLKDGEGKDLSPAVVLVWIGTNDIGQIQPTPPSEQVFCNIRAVCREVEARFPQAKKVLLGLLPRDASAVHPFRRVIKEVNAMLNTYAKEQGWHFMDAGEGFVDAAGHLRMDYLPDGLHLNQAGYAVFLQALQSLLQTLINPQAIAN